MKKPDEHISYIEETYGVTSRNLYTIQRHDDKAKLNLNCKQKRKRQFQSLTDFFTTVFLPHGYPESVSQDYIQYQIWDSIQAFASSITGSLCTHAVLKGAGVGDQNASVLSATITWLIKDGTSMIGRITFAWLKGTQLDRDCKKWRLFADVMNDLAMFLDLLSAYFQNYFMLIICFSGLLKSIVGVAGGSTRAALTQHQARKNNMADVSAKDGSQETLVNLLALVCSLVLVPIVTKSFVFTWMIYISMTILHLTANYFAVKSVTMETFNTARFRIFFQDFFYEGSSGKDLLSVEGVNRKEKVFFSFLPQKTVIKLGTSFKDFVQEKSFEEVKNLFELYRDCDYLLSFESKRNSLKACIKIVLKHKATVRTEMEAMFHAFFLEYTFLNELPPKMHRDNLAPELLRQSRKFVRDKFDDFFNYATVKGFNTDAAFFNTDMWRVDW